MAVDAARPGSFQRMMTFYNEVVSEMRKVTWPDRGQIRNATIGIIIFVLVVGAVITLIDLMLQLVLVRGLPSLVG